MVTRPARGSGVTPGDHPTSGESIPGTEPGPMWTVHSEGGAGSSRRPWGSVEGPWPHQEVAEGAMQHQCRRRAQVIVEQLRPGHEARRLALAEHDPRVRGCAGEGVQLDCRRRAGQI